MQQLETLREVNTLDWIPLSKWQPLSQSTVQTVMASFGAAEIIASRVAIKFLLPNGITGSLIGSAGAAIKELVSFTWLLILMLTAVRRKYQRRRMYLLFLCPSSTYHRIASKLC